MTEADTSTVVITGPTRGLGRETVLSLASRPSEERPDLVLVGRGGEALDDVAAQARSLGARVLAVPVDLASLSRVVAAAATVREAVEAGRVGRLRAVVANAGVQSTDPSQASQDGYELTFAVNHLAHVALLRELDDLLDGGVRIVLVGSSTHRGGAFERAMQVPGPRWDVPERLATPAAPSGEPPATAGRRAYATSKLATLYLAHELQRRVGSRADVVVYDPGLMPGTGLARDAGPAARFAWRTVFKGLRVLPGVTTPQRSGRVLADVAVAPEFAGLRDGAYVELGRVGEPSREAFDPRRERELWVASEGLVDRALT